MQKIERIENLMRLMLAPGIGALGVTHLLRHFGSSDAILGAPYERLAQVPGLRAPQIAAVLQARTIDPRPELAAAHAVNIKLLAYDDPDYPPALLNIADPPFLLYVKGKILPRDEQALGIVGTRHASQYGREMGERFAADLARVGFTVVSGLARGIDTCAHRGALAVGGRTIAFVGCGFKHFYPPENRDLLAEIAQHGAVISEFPLNVAPKAENFPRRNRLIAGIALGVLVIEAAERSGSLITARQALDMGREVFAVPGRVDHEESFGCHTLIREGATLVRRLDDILEELPLFTPESAPAPETLPEIDAAPNTAAPEEKNPASATDSAEFDAELALIENPAPEDSPAPNAAPTTATPPRAARPTVEVSPIEQRILTALADADEMQIDALAETLELGAGELLSKLLMLELRGLIKQLPGKYFCLKRR
jgi:DNA processing protein